jgi:hypothetical protein
MPFGVSFQPASLVEAERRIGIAHQQHIDEDAKHPTVQSHHQIEHLARVTAR